MISLIMSTRKNIVEVIDKKKTEHEQYFFNFFKVWTIHRSNLFFFFLNSYQIIKMGILK